MVEHRCQLGRSQPRAGPVRKHSPRPNVTDFLPAKSDRKKGNSSRNVSPATSQKSSVVSWGDSPREQPKANGEDAVMEDGTETHQAQIKKKIKANDKLRKILTNMPEEHRTLINGDCFKSKMQSLDDETAAWLAANRRFLPLQSRIEIQTNSLERVSKEIESNRRNLWKSCKHGPRLIRNWKQPTLNRYKPHTRWRCWWLNRPQKMQKTVNQGNPRFQTHTSGSISDQAAQQTVLSVFKSVISMQSMGCHGVSEQLMAAGATEDDVKKKKSVMAQTVRKLVTGIAEPGPEAHSLPGEVVGSDEEFSNGICKPGFSNMDTEGQEAIKRSLSHAITEKRRLAKKCKQE